MKEPEQNPTPEPADPLTVLAGAAVLAHELLTGYVAAGFTADQALYLVACILTASLRPGPPMP